MRWPDQPFSADEPQLHHSFALRPGAGLGGCRRMRAERSHGLVATARSAYLGVAQSGAFQHRARRVAHRVVSTAAGAPPYVAAADALSKPQQPDAGVGKSSGRSFCRGRRPGRFDRRGALTPADFPAGCCRTSRRLSATDGHRPRSNANGWRRTLSLRHIASSSDRLQRHEERRRARPTQSTASRIIPLLFRYFEKRGRREPPAIRTQGSS